VDIATIIGIVGALGLIIGSILMDSPISAFINIPGILIVVGGTIMATLVMQRLNVVLGAIKVAMNAFFMKSQAPETIIKTIVSLAGKAKKGGLLALEKEKIPNRFLSRGIRMAVDGVEVDEIIGALRIDLISLVRRHETGQSVFKFMGATAPAMGMIGTLIGLVAMLRSLSDPASIGPAMAIAMLTTFYGSVMAFVIFNPIAEKLADRTLQEKITMEIIITGVEGISKGMSPRILEEKLASYLEPGKRN